MADSWKITGNLPWGVGVPGPTQLELASYAIAAEGIDFDFGSLFKDTYAENALSEGGVLAYDQSGVRQFKFPVRLASSWPGPNGLAGLESYLRMLVRKPAHPSAGFIDLLPDGATQAIRFDILDGRLQERTYNPYMNRAARRDADLLLDVRPFGYMPTKILLASALGGSGIGQPLTWNPTQVLGDVPGLAELFIVPSITPSLVSPLALDGLYWSMSRRTGATLFWGPSYLVAPSGVSAALGASGVWAASVGPDPLAPGGAVLKLGVTPTSLSPLGTVGRFQRLLSASQPDIPAYRGRFRVLAYMRSSPSHGNTWQFIADETAWNAVDSTDLASHNPIATLISQGGGSLFNFPSGYQLLDLGEHALPPAIGSGAPSSSWNLRLWYGGASSNMGIATPFIECGGLMLLPVGGDAGVLPNMTLPSGGVAGAGAVSPNTELGVDSITRRMVIGNFNNPNLQDLLPNGDARYTHAGDFPVVSTAVNLDVVPFARYTFQTADTKFAGGTISFAASVSYRPRFAFLRGF